MDQVEEKKKRAKLHKTDTRICTGQYIFLDESEFSPLYYARFSTEEHAWRAWYLWHSLMVF